MRAKNCLSAVKYQMENAMKNPLIFLLMILLVPVFTVAAGVNTIDKDGLKELIGSENLVVLDVRTGSDWSESDFKIKGAIRVEPGDIESWAGGYPREKTYVLYCS